MANLYPTNDISKALVIIYVITSALDIINIFTIQSLKQLNINSEFLNRMRYYTFIPKQLSTTLLQDAGE